MLYRKIKDTDLKECVYLFMEAFQKAPWNEKWTFEQSLERLEEIMTSKSALGFVVIDHHKVIGMMVGRVLRYLNDYELIIEEICISNDYQGIHLGSDFLEYIKAECQKKNITSITLNTVNGFLSDKFYYKNGFRIKDSIVCMSCDLK